MAKRAVTVLRVTLHTVQINHILPCSKISNSLYSRLKTTKSIGIICCSIKRFKHARTKQRHFEHFTVQSDSLQLPASVVVGIASAVGPQTARLPELGSLPDIWEPLVDMPVVSAEAVAGNSKTEELVRMAVADGPVAHLVAWDGGMFGCSLVTAPPPMERALVHLEPRQSEVRLVGTEDRVASLEMVDNAHPPLQAQEIVLYYGSSLAVLEEHSTEQPRLCRLVLGTLREFLDTQDWRWIIEEMTPDEFCRSMAHYWGPPYEPLVGAAVSTWQDSLDHRERQN